MPRRRLKVIAAALGVALATCGIAAVAFSESTGLPLTRVVQQSVRIVAAEVGSVIYRSDLVEAKKLAEERGYVSQVPGTPPFVFERSDAPHLVAMRERYKLDDIIAGATSEYDAQLKLAAWVGTRFDHGTDTPPGGQQVCDPIAVIEAGSRGARFWCEVAAYTMVHASQAMGWPARMITASTDGYTWEHAVAELWSTEHQKWFVIDTDFNVVFERGGEPLSAWALVHEAPALQADGRLTVRRFAKFKEGLVPQDLLRLYEYAHVDFRSDWCSRRLPRASPASGDRNTLWTARLNGGPPLSAIRQGGDRNQFEFTPIK